MNGGFGLTGQSPSAACRSVWQTPEARIATWIMPGPGSGTGTSSMVSGLPNSRTTAAFMVLAIRYSSWLLCSAGGADGTAAPPGCQKKPSFFGL